MSNRIELERSICVEANRMTRNDLLAPLLERNPNISEEKQNLFIKREKRQRDGTHYVVDEMRRWYDVAYGATALEVHGAFVKGRIEYCPTVTEYQAFFIKNVGMLLSPQIKLHIYPFATVRGIYR